MATIHIDKREAAERQIDTAVALFFEAGDVVSVHTLAAAGGRLVRQLLGDAVSAEPPLFAYVPYKKQAQVAGLLDATHRFFDYGDADALLDGVREEINELMLLQACQWHALTGHTPTAAMEAFVAWFVLMYPDLFVAEHPFKRRLGDADFAWIRLAPRDQQLAMGRKLLLANQSLAPG
jgi:hypothetical protein